MLLDGIKVEALSKAGSKRLTDARSFVYGIRNVDTEEHHQPCAEAGADARADVGCNFGEDRFAGRSPPLLEGVGNDLVPCDADLAAEVCVLPFLGSGHVLNLGLKTVVLAVNKVHKIVQGRFNLRHGCRQAVSNGTNIRIQPLSEADLHAVHRALQQGDGARQVVELGVGHALGRASSIVDGVGQLVVVGLGCVQNGQQALLRTSASNGICHAGFLLIVHVGGGIAQLLDDIGQSAGVALAVKELDAEALQRVEGVAGVRGQAGHNHVQRRTGHRCLDAAVRHKAGHQSHILNGVAKRTSHRRSVLEGFAHHRHVRVGVRRCGSQHVGEHTGIGCFQSKGGKGISHDVGGRAEVFIRRCGQIQDALDAVHHFLGLPSGHSHVIECLSGFGCGELGRCAHFFSFLRELSHLIAGGSADSLNLRHRCLKVFLGVDGIGKAEADSKESSSLKKWILEQIEDGTDGRGGKIESLQREAPCFACERLQTAAEGAKDWRDAFFGFQCDLVLLLGPFCERLLGLVGLFVELRDIATSSVYGLASFIGSIAELVQLLGGVGQGRVGVVDGFDGNFNANGFSRCHPLPSAWIRWLFALMRA